MNMEFLQSWRTVRKRDAQELVPDKPAGLFLVPVVGPAHYPVLGSREPKMMALLMATHASQSLFIYAPKFQRLQRKVVVGAGRPCSC
jgi:hypothetical protein